MIHGHGHTRRKQHLRQRAGDTNCPDEDQPRPVTHVPSGQHEQRQKAQRDAAAQERPADQVPRPPGRERLTRARLLPDPPGQLQDHPVAGHTPCPILAGAICRPTPPAITLITTDGNASATDIVPEAILQSSRPDQRRGTQSPLQVNPWLAQRGATAGRASGRLRIGGHRLASHGVKTRSDTVEGTASGRAGQGLAEQRI